MKNYVSVVLGKIQNKNQKQFISEELHAHIEDRTAYYIEAGFDEETAAIKANEAMGQDADAVGQQLNLIHQNYGFLNIIFAIVNSIMLLFLGAIVFFSSEYDGEKFFLCLTSYSHFYWLTGFVIIMLAELYFALKMKLAFSVFSSAFNLLCYAVLTAGYVPAVFAFYKLLKGEIKSYALFTAFYTVKLENDAVNIISALFIAICILLAVLSLFTVLRFTKAKCSLRTVKFERVLKAMILIVLLFVSVVFAYTAAVLKNCDAGELYQGDFEGVYVIESDEITDPQSVENYDYNYFYIHFDWGSEDVHDYNDSFYYSDDECIECITSYEYYMNDETDVTCKTDRIYAEFKPTEKYVMVVPVFSYWNTDMDAYDELTPDFSKGEWLDTEKENTVVLDDYLTWCTVFKTKVKILAR